jgi:hypothetical protein
LADEITQKLRGVGRSSTKQGGSLTSLEADKSHREHISELHILKQQAHRDRLGILCHKLLLLTGGRTEECGWQQEEGAVIFFNHPMRRHLYYI